MTLAGFVVALRSLGVTPTPELVARWEAHQTADETLILTHVAALYADRQADRNNAIIRGRKVA